MYKDITTEVQNHELDKEIEQSEVEEALNKINENSKTSDGITPKCIKELFPIIINMLLMMFNLIWMSKSLPVKLVKLC